MLILYNEEERKCFNEMEEWQMETRKEKAARLFKEGYNCSQAVFAAYADKYGIDEETALKLSASFGGGMGRMREVCGAVSGMFMIAGLETGATDGKDAAGKKANYDMVQKMAEVYRKENGSIICKELLGLVPMPTRQEEAGGIEDMQTNGGLEAAELADRKTATDSSDAQKNRTTQFTDTQPEARTPEYYKKRPCAELVQMACDIIENVLYENDEA